jgi:hypothetical protein
VRAKVTALLISLLIAGGIGTVIVTPTAKAPPVHKMCNYMKIHDIKGKK